MICKNCGNQINDDVAFCPFCGAKANKPIGQDMRGAQAYPQYQQQGINHQQEQSPVVIQSEFNARSIPQYNQQAADIRKPASVKKKKSKKGIIIGGVVAGIVIIAVIIAVIIGVAGKGSSSSYDNNTIELTRSGTGDLSMLDLSISLFGDDVITPGETTIQDMLDSNWGKDPDSWSGIDQSKKYEYKSNSISGVELDKNSVEASISAVNITEPFTVIENCTITKFYFSGVASFKSASFSCLGVNDFSSTDAFESQLARRVSSYDFKESKYDYATYTEYKVTLDNGEVLFEFTTDNETDEVTALSCTVSFDISSVSSDAE